MRRVILTCDRCKEVIEKEMDLFSVKACLSSSAAEQAHRAEWCRKCCVEVGFLPVPYTNPNKLQPADPPPNLESIIREFIREEMGEK